VSPSWLVTTKSGACLGLQDVQARVEAVLWQERPQMAAPWNEPSVL
jgi:hypothetical protein